MALNIQVFKTRAITALVFVLIMLAGLLINHWTFFLLFSIIHVGCWAEYQRLTGLVDTAYLQITPFHRYSVQLAGWALLLYFTNDAFTVFGSRLHAMGWWLLLLGIFVLPIIELLFARQLNLKNIGYSFVGLIYISLSWGLLMDLRCFDMRFENNVLIEDRGYIIPCGLIFSIWINDTMAYLVGSFVGKTPLTSISPKKTWEGTLGGAILCVTAIALLGWQLQQYRVRDWIAIAGIAAVAGTMGDLLESKLKRMANVKDSGSLMPGHGGFLDRFDSLIVAAPFVWVYVQLFM
jgi:phosphatidate cytidylyltransferase